MAKAPESDPTRDAEFQKVVGYFLSTPPKPKKAVKKPKRKPKRKPGK